MPFWRLDHPDAAAPELRVLRDLAWQQAAELAALAPEEAAALLIAYEAAEDPSAVMTAAVVIEEARDEYLVGVDTRALSHLITTPT